MDKIKFIIESSIDTELEAIMYKNKINLCLTNDWCGDSISGFGASIDIDLDREQVMKLKNFLNEFLNTLGGKNGI